MSFVLCCHVLSVGFSFVAVSALLTRKVDFPPPFVFPPSFGLVCGGARGEVF